MEMYKFASAIQEMLIQSHTGVVKLFPAIPESWQNASFNDLRTQGAFLVSSELKEGHVKLVTIKSEKGGFIKLENPFGDIDFKVHNAEYNINDGIITVDMKPGQEIEIL